MTNDASSADDVTRVARETSTLVSLAEASRLTGRLLAPVAEPHAGLGPSLEDLAECLFFSPGDGRIWLNKQRMVLMPSATFGALRREILGALGMEKGRQALERIGYEQGARDARVIRERWPDETGPAVWATGPRLHALEGYLKVKPARIEFDLQKMSFYGEFLSIDSAEGDEHTAAFGTSEEPCCWLLCGYASGYASTMFGHLILFREVECSAAGDAQCRLIARTSREWEEVDRGFATFVTEQARRVASAKAGGDRARAAVDETGGGNPIVGLSAPFIAARQMLERVAPTEATVLLRGESGSGKELFASTLHRLSERQSGPFIAVNCAAIPDNLVESELFGVERGAFTGATVARPGRFERADGGTLFLDEIASMSASAQGKLLRALQEREIERVGGTRGIAVNVRVVAATNVDLWEEVEARRFRRDLFFRLNVFPIDLPALRDRRDDIPFLVEHFLGIYTALHRKQIRGFSQHAMHALLDYDYPGNVRELQNLVERGVICAESGGLIDVSHVFRYGEKALHGAYALGKSGRLSVRERFGEGRGESAAEAERATNTGTGKSLPEIERELCREALEASGGNLSEAARRIGLTRATLEYRLRKWGLLTAARASKQPHKR
ncbi:MULTISPECIES: sigma-54-dependent Fis family transcriptional regulator [Burkholderia cepacia complex]|uniref:sigma-54-dependent Fis family transcriptional regulator n=1 Tax=Burkholderia cepacia complex TaxID=87882 RepID=UPI001CF1D73E|nr:MULTISPECIES: sigma-54-dependent Fis family transcriptional regulator [Burkholderia cepacia complex]MCA8057367.1 sigma-54-dependent Fis family transcriptional regulator [Burkholderia cepacia]MDN7535192.1 sigma-54-dependent Fis family transcriptional regulator [Burkholderia orbicola]